MCKTQGTQETAPAKRPKQMGLTCCFRVARKVSMYKIDRALGAGNRELKSHLHGHKGPGGTLAHRGSQPAPLCSRGGRKISRPTSPP